MGRPVYRISPFREGTPLRRVPSAQSLGGAEQEEPGTPETLLFELDGLSLEGSPPRTRQHLDGEAEGECRELQWLLEPSSDAEKLVGRGGRQPPPPAPAARHCIA